MGENVNRTKEGEGYLPDISFMGCKRQDTTMKDMITFLERMKNDYTGEREVVGKIQQWCLMHVPNHVDGSYLGVKMMNGNPVEMTDILESGYIDLRKDMWGIHIPGKDILESKKYAWFARMSVQQVLRGNLCISRYILGSY